MPKLTESDHKLIARGYETGLLRTQEQWKEILGELSLHDAAARIFGDLLLYRAEINSTMSGNVRRHGFLGDVQQLANALEAWRKL